VNFVALEEYEREEERCELLRSQRDDLVESKESLEKTIRKINRTAREQFIETFDKVRDNFQETFRVLFRGGKADLIMADGEDPLEAEIDMVAQPLGKRLESIDLLSGGERALTALALLFGIYLVKPSPFCILDEADAALDDANVDRLLEMLFRFKRDTQFILITHNKKTMSAANCLYGVTMAEPGISKIVSVSLDEKELGKKVHPKETVTREETASV
jgi:chromosome segregation protein